MERLYYTSKSYLAHIKLDLCCWFAPVRVGLMVVGYLNILIDLIYIIGIANDDGLVPTIMSVQDTLIEDYVSKVAPIIGYTIELAMNVILLCAIYRRDLVLLRVFFYYTILAVVMSFLTYSMVLAAVPLQIQLAIIFSTVFQIYCIILVRSEMVNLRLKEKQYELPRLVMSSLPSDYPKNGRIHEVTITEVPKQQHVEIAVIGPNDKIKDTKDIYIKKDTKDIDVKKDTKIIIETDPKKTEVKDAEVKVQIESKGKEEKSEDSKKTKEEKKIEEKRLKEEKKLEEKRIKDEKKKEEKRLKEEKKKEGKEKKDIDNKEDEGKEETEEKCPETSNSESNKELKEKWLQAAPEKPKQ